ncbi:MAG TPA: nucleotidyltransferase family protein [Syntrophomonadaceae bacterium]|nr:nucleotidyltransferase family protein [Syntrophomonadaceae bacterium]
MTTLQELKSQKANILAIAKKNGAKNVRVFGSVSKGEAKRNSDIDFLVEFDKGRSLFDLINMKLELEDLLGSEVDIVTENSLHKMIASRIIREAVQL